MTKYNPKANYNTRLRGGRLDSRLWRLGETRAEHYMVLQRFYRRAERNRRIISHCGWNFWAKRHLTSKTW